MFLSGAILFYVAPFNLLFKMMLLSAFTAFILLFYAFSHYLLTPVFPQGGPPHWELCQVTGGAVLGSLWPGWLGVPPSDLGVRLSVRVGGPRCWSP